MKADASRKWQIGEERVRQLVRARKNPSPLIQLPEGLIMIA
jgi:hypothetical protein